jgi:hypothetical protein
MKKTYTQTFIVDTAKWKHSHSFTSLSSYLYRKEGKQEMMCCLGFVCNQLGIPKKYLLNKCAPGRLANSWSIPYLLNEGFDAELTTNAIHINDSDHIPVAKKKRMLKELFNKHGLDIKFEKLS